MWDNASRFIPGQRIAQARYGTAERAAALIDHPAYSHDTSRLWPGFAEFIETRPFFFLASADAAGRCQCNYRGGEPGFVQVEDDRHLYFPDYAGNGLLHTIGNFIENPQVGLLFIDFESGRRIKVNGRVRILDAPETLSAWRDRPGYAGAERIIRVQVEYAVLNCSRFLEKAVGHREAVMETGRERP